MPAALGHGLRTVPLGPTEGLPLPQAEETYGRSGGRGPETTPQRGTYGRSGGRGPETTPQRAGGAGRVGARSPDRAPGSDRRSPSAPSRGDLRSKRGAWSGDHAPTRDLRSKRGAWSGDHAPTSGWLGSRWGTVSGPCPWVRPKVSLCPKQ